MQKFLLAIFFCLSVSAAPVQTGTKGVTIVSSTLPNGSSSGSGSSTSSDSKNNTSSQSYPSPPKAKPSPPSPSPSAPSTHSPSSSSLFPAGHGSGDSWFSWSTSSKISSSLPLSDDTLRPTSNLAALTHPTTLAPDGLPSLQATYPIHSAALSGKDAPIGGFSFYAPGPSSVDITTAKEVTLGYSVFFEEGFAFNLGGKIPGLYGGDEEEGSKSCSGGRRDESCWSTRFMWREGGKGELYTYLPPSSIFPSNTVQCSIPPLSDCNDIYGASVGRGSFTFTPGHRSTIAQRVRLNDVGKSNGEVEVWFEGKSVISLKGVVLRDSERGVFRGIQMQTFFGGHAADPWGSPKEQKAWFGDFSVAITELL